MTTNWTNNIIRGLFRRIQERLVGGRRPPLSNLSYLGKPRLLHRIFEHDDTCVHLGMFREVFFGDAFPAMLFRRCFSGDAFPAMLFRRCFSGDAFSYSLSYLGISKPFTTYLNTMTTNSSNKVIRGLPRGYKRGYLSYLGISKPFTTCLNTMTTNWTNNIIRGLPGGYKRGLSGAFGPPFVQPLMFRKTKSIFTECLNTMTTNWTNKVIRGLPTPVS